METDNKYYCEDCGEIHNDEEDCLFEVYYTPNLNKDYSDDSQEDEPDWIEKE